MVLMIPLGVAILLAVITGIVGLAIGVAVGFVLAQRKPNEIVVVETDPHAPTSPLKHDDPWG